MATNRASDRHTGETSDIGNRIVFSEMNRRPASRCSRIEAMALQVATGAEVERRSIDGGGACAPCRGDNDSTKARQNRPKAKATRGKSRRYSTAVAKLEDPDTNSSLASIRRSHA